jgi:GTPase SAR1 family protein
LYKIISLHIYTLIACVSLKVNCKNRNPQTIHKIFIQNQGDFVKSPKQLRRELADLTTHLTQVQAGLQNKSNIKVASIGKECTRSAEALGQLLRSHQVPDTYKVAVVGRFKVGKSSFVNELLGTSLASERTLPETAAVTTFKHGPRIQAAIRFIQRSDWEDLKALYEANPKITDAQRVSSWWKFLEPKEGKDGEPPPPLPDLAELEQAHVLDQAHTVVLEHSAKDTQTATRDFRKALRKYTSSSSPLHCLVDRVDITAPSSILDEGVLLIDTPGLDDPERFRVTLTEQVVAEVDAVLFLTQSGGSYGQSEKDFLLSLLRKGTVKQLIVVVTQIDQTYEKVLDEAENDDETPPSLANCIKQEEAKIRRDINDTLKDLGSDPNLQRYQEQLGDIPIAFTSAHLHRAKPGNLPFVIDPKDPGGVVGLKKKLLTLLSEESRLANTAQQIVKGASQTLEDLKGVLENKLQALEKTQNKEVAEQKLHTFREEFGQAREGFARAVEQQVRLLTERLAEQPRRDETMLSLIAALAEQTLLAFEAEDKSKSYQYLRHRGFGSEIRQEFQVNVAKTIFPRVQQLLDTRTELFTKYAERFEDVLLQLSRDSDDISARLELGTSVPLDVSGKLKVVLERSMQRAQEMIATEERNVLHLLDAFVEDEMVDRISAKRKIVIDTVGTGTHARQKETITTFYRELNTLLREALQNYLHDSTKRFGEFLLAEAKAAPRDALDDVQVLLEQAADNILAAATLHLAGQKEEASALITGLDNELVQTLNKVGTLLSSGSPVMKPTAPSLPMAAAATATTPQPSPPAARAHIEGVDWADNVQGAATSCVARLQLREGSTGWSYDKLFDPQFLQGALQLSLIDPYLYGAHQLRNLKEFLLHVAETIKPKAIEIITAHADNESTLQQNRVLESVSKDLFEQFGVALTLRRETGLHDRYLRLDHGVLFKLGRGLDIYKPATGLAAHRPASRRVRATEIDVFVVPANAS